MKQYSIKKDKIIESLDHFLEKYIFMKTQNLLQMFKIMQLFTIDYEVLTVMQKDTGVETDNKVKMIMISDDIQIQLIMSI